MKKLFWSFLMGMMLMSCARVGSPVGGSKDTIPPNFLRSNIDSPRTNVSRNLKELRLYFDEYVKLKNVQKNLIISPPIKKMTRMLPSNLANKYILLEWEDELEENTTYNFNFGNAIVDNNEENVLPYFNFAFTTGDKLDENYISGEVSSIYQKSNTKSKNIVVGLYKSSDSINYKNKPYYVTRADDDGYYEINYIAPGKYKLIAFGDENENTIYDPGKEDVAFIKEDIDLTQSISGQKLNLYPSKKAPKFSELKAMPGGIQMIFEKGPETLEVFSKSDKLKDIKVTHKAYSDTARIWFDTKKFDPKTTENVKLAYRMDSKVDSTSLFYKPEAKSEMTLAMVDAKLVPFQPLKIQSNYHIESIDTSKWVLKSDSVTVQPFEAEISKTNPFQVLVKSDFKEGKEYQLTVVKNSIRSFYEANNNSYRFDFTVDKIENYSNLLIKLINRPETYFWVELLDSNNNVIYSKYTNEEEVKFSFINPQTYTVRMLVDTNNNGIWDVSDLQEGVQAEPVYMFYKVLTPRPLWELNEQWDIKDPRSLELPKKVINSMSIPMNSASR